MKTAALLSDGSHYASGRGSRPCPEVHAVPGAGNTGAQNSSKLPERPKLVQKMLQLFKDLNSLNGLRLHHTVSEF